MNSFRNFDVESTEIGVETASNPGTLSYFVHIKMSNCE